MLRMAVALWLGGWCLCWGAGCQHITESRAINGFSKAMVREDLDALRKLTTADFERRALRGDDALADLKFLHLPTDEIKVVKVEDKAADHRLVTIEVGKAKRRYYYDLVRDDGSRRWLIDDIYEMRRRDGVQITKAVTEQMDLLLSVREFHAAWDSGDRDRTLAVVTPEFRKVLSELPPAQLSHLTRSAIGEKPSKSRLRIRNAEIDDDVAIVSVPRMLGQMILTLKLSEDDGWQVSDLAVERHGEEESIPSVLKTATAVRAANGFLVAYAADDKQRLMGLAETAFYNGTLKPADLSTAPLPPSLPTDNCKIKMHQTGASLILPRENDTVTLSLKRIGTGSEDVDGTEIRYVVDDVTIYQPSPGDEPPQEIRLSALFTGKAVVQLYGEALARCDLTTLNQLSTADFQSRVWQKLHDLPLERLDVLRFDAVRPQIVTTDFRGTMAEVTVLQGHQTLTYVLRDRDGEMRVDDVLVPSRERPESLKKVLELLLPVRTFTAALAAGDLSGLQRNSSDDFNRLVWNQTNRVPQYSQGAVANLNAAVGSIAPVDKERVLVTLGSSEQGAKVLLITEHGKQVIDDILVISGPTGNEQARLKRTLRDVLANGGKLPDTTPGPTGDVMQASHETAAPPQQTSSLPEPTLPEPGLLPVPDDAAWLPPPEEPVREAALPGPVPQ